MKKRFAHLRGRPRAVAEKLDDLLMRIEPRFEVGPAWSGVGYKLGRNYSCLIAGYPDHVKLMIWRGIELDDPGGHLRGTGKNTRHLRLDKPEDLKPTVIRKLLKQQHALFAAGMTAEDKPTRRRRLSALPAFVRTELEGRGLRAAFDARPPYQRTDYVGWITGAKREATRWRRLEQMLEELEAGDRYMKMPWRSR